MKNLELRLDFKGRLPKTGDSINDCQDAVDVNLEAGRLAVADGVTRSFFPAEWSSLLVKQFCHDNSKSNEDLFKTRNWSDWLLPIQDKWSALIHDKVSKKTGPDAIHLNNSIKTRDPAASTFVGLQIDVNAQSLTWKAMIIGDSCLFYFRKNGEFTSYLIKNSLDFNHHPQYFSSVSSFHSESKPSFINGNFEAGDVFVLATDALAKWLLVQKERNSTNWDKTLQTLMNIKSQKELYSFVSSARNNKEFPMEDDDVTLVILSCIHKEEISKKLALPIHTGEKETRHNKLSDLSVVSTRTVEKRPQPVAPVARPSKGTPSYTPPAPMKPTRSKIRRKNTRKKSPSSKSALSVLAIIIALISVLINLYTLFIFWSYRGNAIAPTVQIMPTPTRFHLTKSAIPANIPVYLDPYNKSQILFTTQGNTSVTVLKRGERWDKVEIELWLFSNNGGDAGFVVQDGLIITQTTVPAYSGVSTSPVAVGLFSPDVVLQKTNEFSDATGVWYRVKFQGYVFGQ